MRKGLKAIANCHAAPLHCGERQCATDPLRLCFRNFGLLLVLLTAHCFLLPAIDFSFRPRGFAFIPLGLGNRADTGYERYSIGGGGDLGVEVDLASVWSNPLGLGYALGLETSIQINPLRSYEPENVSFYSAAAAAGVYGFPLSRLFIRIDGALGVYGSARQEESSHAGLYWRGGGEIGFRFTPIFTLAANAGWRQYVYGFDIAKSGVASRDLLNSGVYAGVTAHITVQTGRGANREGVDISLDQYENIYPVFMQLYQRNPIGSIHIRNDENAEIRNVRLSFRADGYTASEFPCGVIPLIPRGRSAELPLYADFSPALLTFTDTGRIVGELVIRYRFLGQERETVRAVTLATYNRNRVTSGGSAASDIAELAAFISPTSPETLDFARFVAGLARANTRIGYNQNMMHALWLLECLRASSMRLGETYTSEREAQFPAETLAFRTGSSRDLALLFAAALEGVGISTAFISVNRENDFLVALNLGIGQSATETLFSGTDKILAIDGEVWLPISMNGFNEGFMAAWTQGAALLNRAFAEDLEVVFVLVEEAWALYPPAPLPELASLIHTDTEAAITQVNRALRAYIAQEIYPLIEQVSNEQRTSSQGVTAAGQNRLGILNIRAGRIDEGKAAYEQAARMGSVPAMTNRGNLALTEGDFTTAEQWFTQALAQESENRAALRGIERVRGSR